MFDMLFWLAVGAFVGWNLPQPAFAKAIQSKAVTFAKSLFIKGE